MSPELTRLSVLPPWDWPESAASDLLTLLQGTETSPDDRLLAAQFAGDSVVINDDLAAALLAIVDNADAPDQLRGTAAIALGPALAMAEMEAGEYGDPDDVPISMAMVESILTRLEAHYANTELPKLVRRRVLEVAVRYPQDWHVAAVRSAWQSADRDWQLTAVFAMQYLEGFDAEILEALERDDEICSYAIAAAGNWEIQAARRKVKAVLSAPGTPTELLLPAFDAIVSLCPDQAADLLEPYLDDEDEEIAAAADEALAMGRIITDDDDDDDDDTW